MYCASADGITRESMTATPIFVPEYFRGRRASVPSKTSYDRYDVKVLLERLLTGASVEMLTTSGSRAAARSAFAETSATKRSGVVDAMRRVVGPERLRRSETRGPAAGATLINARTDAVVGC